MCVRCHPEQPALVAAGAALPPSTLAPSRNFMLRFSLLSPARKGTFNGEVMVWDLSKGSDIKRAQATPGRR